MIRLHYERRNTADRGVGNVRCDALVAKTATPEVRNPFKHPAAHTQQDRPPAGDHWVGLELTSWTSSRSCDSLD